MSYYNKNRFIQVGVLLAWACLSPVWAETFRWSDPDFWGGSLPGESTDVVVAAGDTLIFDVSSAHIGDLTIRGTLTFADQDFFLTADNIYVAGGTLQAGTPENPFSANGVIEIVGQEKESEIEGHSSEGRHLIAGMGSTISIYTTSARKTQWTRLGKTALPGDTSIILAGPTSWEVGDQLVVAPSGYDYSEMENLTITAVSPDKTVIEVTPALQYKHIGEKFDLHGREFDMRAEVGLLNRNLKIKGPDRTYDESADDYQFGFHAMFLHHTKVNMSGVELVNGGQTGSPARYPFHWHRSHDVEGSSITNSSIHHSHQRGIVVHQTQRALVSSNVLYHIKDHGIVFSEDGNETDNQFIGNLVMNIIKKQRGTAEDEDAPGEFAFPLNNHDSSVQGENRPGGFWGRNYHNTFIGNHVAGIYYGNGFFFHSKGRQVSMEEYRYQPSRLVFQDNLVHSISRVEGKVYYGPQASGHALFVDDYPTKNDDKPTADPIVFSDFTAYKIRGFGAWIENRHHVLDKSRFTQASNGVFVRRSTIRDNFFSSTSPNDVGGSVSPRSIRGQTVGYGVVTKSGRPTPWPTLIDNTFADIRSAAIGMINYGIPELGSDRLFTNKGATLINVTWPVETERSEFDLEFVSETEISNVLPQFPFLDRISDSTRALVDIDGSINGSGATTYFSFDPLPASYGESVLRWDVELQKKTRKGWRYNIFGAYFETIVGEPLVAKPSDTTSPGEVVVTPEGPKIPESIETGGVADRISFSRHAVKLALDLVEKQGFGRKSKLVLDEETLYELLTELVSVLQKFDHDKAIKQERKWVKKTLGSSKHQLRRLQSKSRRRGFRVRSFIRSFKRLDRLGARYFS